MRRQAGQGGEDVIRALLEWLLMRWAEIEGLVGWGEVREEEDA